MQKHTHTETHTHTDAHKDSKEYSIVEFCKLATIIINIINSHLLKKLGAAICELHTERGNLFGSISKYLEDRAVAWCRLYYGQ